jgi:hypothetical protein
MAQREGSIGSAVVWIFVISILLFWLPVLGPLIAGFVGGRRAGGLGNALIACILPGILLSVALFFLGSVLTLIPVLGFVFAAGGLALAFAHIGPLLLGAILGAVL